MRKKNKRDERFEFVFYINGNIIVQRFFEVPNYNPNFPKSVEVKELMDSVMGMNNGPFGELGIIPNTFKEQNMRAEWRDYRPYYSQSNDQIKSQAIDLFEKEDIFSFKLKVDRRTIGEAQFCGNYFPKYVRHFVDITGVIGDVIDEITNYMSLAEYNHTYGEVAV